jgi:hypothetical protein
MVTQLNFLHLRLKFLVPEKNWRHIKKCFCNSLLNCDNESFQSMRLKTDFVTYLKLKASAKNVFALRALPPPPHWLVSQLHKPKQPLMQRTASSPGPIPDGGRFSYISTGAQRSWWHHWCTRSFFPNYMKIQLGQFLN